MSLVTLTYILPALLGYILFVGIAGRFNPLVRPAERAERPSWLLGLWTGLAITMVLVVGLRMAYGLPPEATRELILPSAWLFAASMLPGLIACFIYRHRVNQDLDAELPVLATHEADTDSAEPLEHSLDQMLQLPEGDEPLDDKLAAALDTHLPVEKSSSSDLTLADASDALPADTVAIGDSAETTADAIPVTDPAYSADAMSDISELHLESESGDSGTLDDATADPALIEQLQLTQAELESEKTLRHEAETHLRITRKALAVLEGESRDYESTKADALMELEDALEKGIRDTAAAEARADREHAARVSVDTTVVTLKQDLVKAKQDLRRSTAARAKALAAANKSVALARHSVQARTRLESRMKDASAALDNRQATISSLIRALEKEKRRTQADVASMAKQLVLHEKQLDARRSLEEVARSVEGKLSTRLVKKVAKARPLADHS